MEHTRAHLKRQRGLYVLIAALIAAWMLEPDFSAMFNICRGLIERIYGGM